jgi:hypothetical protein
MMESQEWQIAYRLIPALGAKCKVRALNAKKKEERIDFTVRK